MSLTPYSSVSAFIAHCHVLRATDSPARDEIERLLAELSDADRDALGLGQVSDDTEMQPSLASDQLPAAAGQPSDAASRRRARAELKLHRLLAAHGLLLS
jgi:hypothetical protein